MTALRVLAAWNSNVLPAFGITTALGVWLHYLQDDGVGVDNALGFALVVQMFAASTGFRAPAVLGEFDLLLVRARRRCGVVLAHWIVSVAPVAAAWLLLAALDVVVVRRGWPTGLTVAPVFAFLWVSVAAWAIGAWLGRNASGALWLLIIFVLGASGWIRTLRDLYVAPPGGAQVELSRLAVTLVFPFFPFADPTVVTAPLLAGLVVAAALVLAAAAMALSVSDVPLRSRA